MFMRVRTHASALWSDLIEKDRLSRYWRAHWWVLLSPLLYTHSLNPVSSVAYNNVPLKAAMTITNEPGYYADGEFGIRTENIMLVREAKTPNNFGDKGYLGFGRVTMWVATSIRFSHTSLLFL
jgi:hypothetical protein